MAPRILLVEDEDTLRSLAARALRLQEYEVTEACDGFEAWGLAKKTRFDLIITLCDKVREICPEFPGTPPAAHWSIADPAASGDDDDATYPAFQRVADEIENRVALLLAELMTPTH